MTKKGLQRERPVPNPTDTNGSRKWSSKSRWTRKGGCFKLPHPAAATWAAYPNLFAFKCKRSGIAVPLLLTLGRSHQWLPASVEEPAEEDALDESRRRRRRRRATGFLFSHISRRGSRRAVDAAGHWTSFCVATRYHKACSIPPPPT